MGLPVDKKMTGPCPGGMKGRLDLPSAMARTPELLILDEPTEGPDPQSRPAPWEELARVNKGKKGRKNWFPDKIGAELATHVTVHQPKRINQPLFCIQRSDAFTANTLTHIVNGVCKGPVISRSTSHSGERTEPSYPAARAVS